MDSASDIAVPTGVHLIEQAIQSVPGCLQVLVSSPLLMLVLVGVLLLLVGSVIRLLLLLLLLIVRGPCSWIPITSGCLWGHIPHDIEAHANSRGWSLYAGI